MKNGWIRNPAHTDHWRVALACGIAAAWMWSVPAWSQQGTFAPAPAGSMQSSVLSPSELKSLSLEDLIAIEVTSVSKRPEPLAEAASAIQVITREEIRRSGATSIPEALRLAPNLQVAQVNASQWAISARGFNNVLANKLLVQIDGRSLYTPLYAGVFWDVQNVLLEDVDRIEVVSGPGGSLWGSNAVNGIINIITKDARETQGLFAKTGAGSELRRLGRLRWGGRAGERIYYRAYAAGFERDNTRQLDGSEAKDDWDGAQGGFRADWEGDRTRFTIQGDYYDVNPDPEGGVPVDARGGNGLARVEHSLGEQSDLWLTTYYDQTDRDFNNGLREKVTTLDVESRHRIAFTDAQEVVYGAGFRWMRHDLDNLELFGFFPDRKDLRLYSAFAQDAIAFAEDRLKLTVGVKFEHNDYTGAEWQPNGRIAWTPREGHLVWTAVSRAIRMPSRIDRDFIAYLAPELPLIQGSKQFESEGVIAFEGGWRVQPSANLTGSVSVFHNEYDDIRSAEPPEMGPIPITFGNGVEGTTDGVEVALACGLTSAWTMRLGYTYLTDDLRAKSTSRDLNEATAESNDPPHQVRAHSSLNLPYGFEFDTTLRWVDALPHPHVPSYIGLGARLAWISAWGLEVSVVGQNLAEEEHLEFIPSSPDPRKIERSGYAAVTMRL